MIIKIYLPCIITIHLKIQINFKICINFPKNKQNENSLFHISKCKHLWSLILYISNRIRIHSKICDHTTKPLWHCVWHVC